MGPHEVLVALTLRGVPDTDIVKPDNTIQVL